MEIITKYIHGSADSTDVDVYYVVDEVPPFQAAKAWCDAIKNENANLISIKDGVVNACYKGVPDECNNSLIDTYNLHIQTYPLLISRCMERDLGLKYLRAVRIILSHLSRSQYRPEVKKALASSNFKDKLLTLNKIDLSTIDFNNLSHNQSGADVLKVIAFQIGQVYGLSQGIELYTKSKIADYYPDLSPFLYRYSGDLNVLNICLKELCIYLSIIIENESDGKITFNNGKTYDVLKEKRLI